MASYDRCLELNPNSVKASENKASLLTDLGRYAEARSRSPER
ncbi:tetratricopeptide repeat protein [Streptomyces sp. NPDC049916]